MKRNGRRLKTNGDGDGIGFEKGSWKGSRRGGGGQGKRRRVREHWEVSLCYRQFRVIHS
jgi:hypothetical protein